MSYSKSDIAIETQGLAKTYLLYPSPRHRLWQFLLRGTKQFYTPIEALKPLDIIIHKGESIGIVGRNGSGKSTLLQLLCGTLNPTSGAIKINGRISALLELGAGFNPDFTGRENIYLNGAIIGLSQQEIKNRFSEITEFANIGKFIDQPVSTYSSGMVVRLAFAIAVSVNPDILVVDEALAVGDESFQRKCFARIDDMKHSGTTILFVSHAAQTIIDICDRTLLIDQGELLLEGEPHYVITHYQKLAYAPIEQRAHIRNAIKQDEKNAQSTPTEHIPFNTTTLDPSLASESAVEYPAHGARIINARLLTETGEQVNVLVQGKYYRFVYDLELEDAAKHLRCGMLIKNKQGTEIAGTVINAFNIAPTSHTVAFSFHCLLNPGTYFLNCGATSVQEGDENYLHRLVDALMFRILRNNEKDNAEMTMAGLVNLEFTGKISGK